MSLEPIKPNLIKPNIKIDNKLNIIKAIKEEIYSQTQISVGVKNLTPPKLIITVTNSSAANNLYLQSEQILQKFPEYTKIQILIR
jgi:hypothetical protein